MGRLARRLITSLKHVPEGVIDKRLLQMPFRIT
jgi:hypothetical protein